MDTPSQRWEQEMKALEHKVLENFLIKINDVLTNGTAIEIWQLISAYNMYYMTNYNIIKDNENRSNHDRT